MLERIDKGLFVAIITLTVFGLIMISSVSIAGSFEITGKNDFYFWRHFWYIIMGIPLFLAAIKFPSENLKKIASFFFILSIALIILTMLIGQSYGTIAKIWLKIGPISFQPIEIVKLAVIIFLSALFSNGKTNTYSFERGFVPFAIILGIPSVLLALQSDFGSLLVLVLTATCLYFVAGANIKHLLGGMLFAGAAGTIIMVTTPYILHRVKVFLNPDLDPLNTGFQVKQALIAIGSGGLFGRGFQNSIQKYDYLPEVQSDTIFSAISEEMGFLRILILVGLYLFIAYRGFFIAKNASSPFKKYIAVGITTWFVGQAFVNIGVNLALLPNTGLTLPLISYGGTSLIMSLICMGILLNISKDIYQKKRIRS